jgi:pimeloyl-ACP methyl ester carboxylesterase
MTKMSRQYTLATSHGSIAVEETGHGGLPTLLIHGNSSCRGVFRNQMEGPLAKNHRLIAFDLPGHGQSSDAPDRPAAIRGPALRTPLSRFSECSGLWMSGFWLVARRPHRP